MNETNPILKRLMRSLPINTLEKLLLKNYKRFRNLYNNDYNINCLLHMEEDPRDKIFNEN